MRLLRMRPFASAALIAAAALSLSACGPNSGGVNSAGSFPAATAAAVADATLPPPSAVVPAKAIAGANQAIDLAFDGLDTTRAAADLVLKLQPGFAGTPAAIRLANGLDGTATWLNIARAAARAGSADSYHAALDRASAAYSGAKAAIAELRSK